MFLPVPASRPSYYCIVLNGVPDRKVQLVPKFKEYDHDKNGYITLDEASRILQNPPYSLPAGIGPYSRDTAEEIRQRRQRKVGHRRIR